MTTTKARPLADIRRDARTLTALHADMKAIGLSGELSAQAGHDILSLLDRIDALTSAVHDPAAPDERHLGEGRVQVFRNNERYCVWDRHGIAHPPHEWRYAYTRAVELGGITTGSYYCDGAYDDAKPYPLPPASIESAPEDPLAKHDRRAPDCAYRIPAPHFYREWCRQCRYDQDQGVYGQTIAQPRPEGS